MIRDFSIPPEQIERNKSFVPSSERSEEVQAIVDRMPTKGAFFVAYVVIVLVAVVLIFGVVISYPDTDGRISITSSRVLVCICVYFREFQWLKIRNC